MSAEHPTMKLSERFAHALEYAAHVHRGQVRKGTPVPYLSHLLGVASLVLDSGGDEDEAIAALLHDAPEDQGGVARLEDITLRFGLRVGAIVKACSDSLVADPSQKSPWRQRKEIYIDHLLHNTDPSVHLVSVADKLHNSRSIMFERRRLGTAIWASLKGGKAGTLWSYRALIEVYRTGPPDDRRRYLVAELEASLDALEKLAD